MMFQKTFRIYIFILIIFICFLAVSLAPGIFFKNDGFFSKGLRLVHDGAELNYFYQRGSWLPERLVPYKDVPQEYPQVGLLFLTLPFLFADDLSSYAIIFFLMAGICFFLLVLITQNILKKLDKNQNYVWLLFLPSVLYFTFNRFDILSALLVQFSLFLFLTKRYRWSMFWLGLATLTKWYAGLFFFVYFIYFICQLKFDEERRKAFGSMIVFCLTIFIPIFLTAIFAGLAAAISPYLFHLQRTGEVGSLYSFLVGLEFWKGPIFSGLVITDHTILNRIILSVFILLQFSGLVLLMSKAKIRDNKGLINWLVFVLLLFIIFMRIYSNQWIIWFLPLLILILETKKEIILFVVYDLLNYLQFPILFDINPYSISFNLVSLVRTIILFWFIWVISKRLEIFNFRFPSLFRGVKDLPKPACRQAGPGRKYGVKNFHPHSHLQ